MTSTSVQPTTRAKRFASWFPTHVARPVRVLAWASFVLQVVLIGTGGAVRLTASGLGCPTWPECTSASLVNTPELGIHGIIEFSNRMLTVVLSIVVILMFLAVLRMRRSRPDLFWLALIQGLSIPFQAVLGGITVLSGLNPYVVGLHFVVSIFLVVLTVVLVYRVYTGRRSPERLAPNWFVGTTYTTAFFVALTVVFGIITTGSGPHAGDNSDAKALAPRNGLDPVTLQHVHSIPAYATFGLTVLLVIAIVLLGDRARNRNTRRFLIALLGIEVVQIVVGITQAREGLPIVLVNIHLVLAALLVAATTAVILSQRGSIPSPAPAPEASTSNPPARGGV